MIILENLLRYKKELLLRVQTLIKKKKEFSNKNEVVEISPNVTFNTISNELKSNNEEIKLNLKELKLLKFFSSKSK